MEWPIFIYIFGLIILLLPLLSIDVVRNFIGLALRRRQGDQLLSEIQTLRYHSQGKIPPREHQFPQYKFYTKVLIKLLDHTRNWGGAMQAPLMQLQQGIRQEIKADRQMGTFFFQGIAQFAMTAVITWSFCLGSSFWTGFSISWYWALAIGVLQFMGVAFYLIYLLWAQRFYLSQFWSFLAYLYQLQSCCSSGVSARQLMELTDEKQMPAVISKSLLPLSQRLRSLLYLYTQLGQGISVELSDLVDDLWHLYNEAREKLIQRTGGIKFLILAIFFLSAHLLYFLALAGSFLIEEV